MNLAGINLTEEEILDSDNFQKRVREFRGFKEEEIKGEREDNGSYFMRSIVGQD